MPKDSSIFETGMNVLIIEENALYRKVLFETLEGLEGEVHILGYTDSIQSTLDWFINHPQPDLIFISTELPEGPTINLFKEIRISSPLIFMAMDGKFALQSFKYNTIDYLVRPITRNSLISSIFKFRTLRGLFQSGIDQGSGHSDISNTPILEKTKRFKNRFAIHIGDKIKSLESDEIAYFMADGNVVYLGSFQKDRFTINYTLDNILEKLDPAKFFRLNRTFIVNIQAIKEVRKFFNGRLKIILQPAPEPDEEVFVSRNRVSEFLKWLGE